MTDSFRVWPAEVYHILRAETLIWRLIDSDTGKVFKVGTWQECNDAMTGLFSSHPSVLFAIESE